jgi:signal transduction histidine kinase
VRFTAFLGVLLFAVLGVSTLAMWLSFSNRSNSQALAQLTATVQDYSRAMAAVPADQFDRQTVSYLSSTVLPAQEELVVSLPGPKRYGTSGSTVLIKNPGIKALSEHPPAVATSSTIGSGGLNLLVLSTPVVRQGATVGSVVATYDLAPAVADQNRVLQLALVEAGLALVAGVLGAYFLLRRLLGTVGRITSTAKTIEEGDLDRRLGDQGTDDEVGELAATFDSMLDRIDEVMGVQRRMLSDVSHQLKTPLTVIRGHLEVLIRTSMDDPEETRTTINLVIAEIDHMRELTEDLLLLGRALEPDFVSPAPVDLRSFIGELQTAAIVLGDRHYELAPVDDLVISADEAKLRGAVLNLIDNATGATSAGDVVRIGAGRRPDGSVAISIEDSGPGIPVSERAKVLARFGRPDSETREGSGLGLAIVRTVAAAHGGWLELDDSELGGLAAIVVLPSVVVLPELAVERSSP